MTRAEDMRPLSGYDALGQARMHYNANVTKAKAAGASAERMFGSATTYVKTAMQQKKLQGVYRAINSCANMSASDDDEIDKLECQRMAEASKGRVVIQRAIADEFRALPENVRGHFKRVMELWCNDQTLTDTMINRNEGRSSRTGTMLQAFKAFKVRLYGFVVPINGLKSFVVCDIDPVKKQNKGDKGILKRARGRADAFIEGMKK